MFDCTRAYLRKAEEDNTVVTNIVQGTDWLSQNIVWRKIGLSAVTISR